MARRVTLSTVLLAGAATLVGAIVVGNAMGNRVLGQVGRMTTVSSTPIAIPSADASPGAGSSWKHVSLAAVATDPAFPDPRVTPPPPPPPPPPKPAPRATPRPPTPEPVVATPTPEATSDYTSPPLPIPLISATPDPETTLPLETATPLGGATPSPSPGARPRAPAAKMTPNAIGP